MIIFGILIAINQPLCSRPLKPHNLPLLENKIQLSMKFFLQGSHFRVIKYFQVLFLLPQDLIKRVSFPTFWVLFGFFHVLSQADIFSPRSPKHIMIRIINNLDTLKFRRPGFIITHSHD